MSDRFIINPHMVLTIKRHQGEINAFETVSPVTGSAVQTATFTKQEHPAIFSLLEQIAARKGAVHAQLDTHDRERLVRAGILVPEEGIVAPPRFSCSPFDIPSDFPSKTPPSPAPISASDLTVNPTLRIWPEPPMPEGFSTHAREKKRFAKANAWATVEHPRSALESLYSIDDNDLTLFEELTRSSPALSTLGETRLQRLIDADILVAKDNVANWQEGLPTAPPEPINELKAHNHAVIPQLVHPVQLRAMRAYYRRFIAAGCAHLGDSQVPDRYCSHNEPLARFFHHKLTPFASLMAGEEMKPSYVYFASYLPGATLARHTDRAQCALSASVLIDYLPEPDGPSPWALWLGHEGAEKAFHLGLGDALFFRGTVLPHRRDALPEGHCSTSLFFHYVPIDFNLHLG